jgi:hypothetical protein
MLLIFEIAFQLKMSAFKLMEEMSYAEFLCWLSYFEQRPVGWRDDDRVYKILQTQGVKAPPGKIFASLRPIYSPERELRDGELDNGFKGSFMFQKLQEAVGGERLPIE